MEKTIRSINSSIDEVNQINQVINGIASQTSLLSMNAAIEAAHAGEAGKGFAVVATEIRNLSESTTKNAKLIGATLKKMVGFIKSVMEHSAANMATYTEIVQESAQLSDAFREIYAATGELDTGSSEIVSATQTLRDITETIRSGSGEITTSALDIRHSIEEIVAKSRNNNEETTKISDVARRLNMVFLDMSGTFLKYDDAVSRMGKLRNFGKTLANAENILEVVPVMIQHLLWIIRARGVIDGKMSLDPATIIDHTSCHLGKWIATGAPDDIKKTQAFKKLVADHEKMHSLVKEIISVSKTATRQVLETKFDDLLMYSGRILDELKNMYTMHGSTMPA
jgi:methyl-accepting chemotaxis protein